MKKLKKILGSFRTKVTVLLILALLLVLGLSNLFIYQFSLDAQFSQLRIRLIGIAQTAALMVDADLLRQVPLNREGIKSSAYKSIAGQLQKIKDANPTLKYIYTMARTAKEDIVQFIVDPEPQEIAMRGSAPTSFPGDTYDASRFPALLEGFKVPTSDKKLGRDEWGVFLSGYAPIRDKSGKTVAILGIDMDAKDVYLTQKEVKERLFYVLGIGFLACLIIGFYLSSRLSKRIERLVHATRKLAADDLSHQVDVKGHDEIGELAESFNNMARSLAEARRQLQDYFYRVMQALVHMLEAKDVYTRGHSERVANYSEKIALGMGYTYEDAQTVKKIAQLHDIGKLVIHESILNKKDKLTEEEWIIIRAHPVTGEQILKPVLLDQFLLSMVRSHHERFDGSGYPDGLDDGKINQFAQIITVADAFDAMTSDRAYRSAMTRGQAIEELRRNSGSQFNPAIIEVFLEILAEEERNKK